MAKAIVKKKRGLAFRIFRALLGLLVALMALVYFVYVLPFWGIPFNKSRHGRVPLTPPWALECWLWEDDANNAAAVKELLEGYAQHDLPVRTIMIDSPWSERYNDFKVDQRRYPEPEVFFRSLEEKGYRVVLWMTCMVNSSSKEKNAVDAAGFFEHARTNRFLAGNGDQIKWWKGRGGFIDYSNADAMKWWHGLQQPMFDWGIDGWKLDGCDTLFHSEIAGVPVPFNRTKSGWMTTRQFMDHYAREEYQHGLKQNSEFVTLIRAKDHPWRHPEGFSPLDAAPVTWVGDNRHAWTREDWGLEAALDDILGSARIGYCVIGSDVGGYHGGVNREDIKGKPSEQRHPKRSSNDEIPPNLYIRWAQFSTFCGLLLNGGHGERRLWKRSAAELEIIRKFSWLHTELVPYTYSQVVNCHNGGSPLMRPLSASKFHYRFGDDFLVAPIHEDKLTRTVSLPAGQWRYLFDDREVMEGPRQLTRDFPLDEFPVFAREGAVVPLKVTRDYTGFGDRDSAEFTTWLIYPNGRSEFTLWNPETHPQPEATTVKVESGVVLKIQFSGRKQPHLMRIHTQSKPQSVTLDGQLLAEGEAWQFESASRKLVIKTRNYTEGDYRVSWH